MANIDMNISDEKLVAYVDGELEAHEVVKVEAALKDSSNLRKKAEDYKESASILKGAFSIDGVKTPDNILSRIDAIEKTIKNPIKVNNQKSFFQNIYSFFQLQYAVPTFAAFAFGILLGPTLLGPTASFKGSSAFPENQITLRGSSEIDSFNETTANPGIDEYLTSRIIQDGENIQDGGSIRAGVPFFVILLAPINGTAVLQEVSDNSEETVLDSQDMAAGRYITFAALQVDNQDSLSLRVSLTNADTQISYILNFMVQN